MDPKLTEMCEGGKCCCWWMTSGFRLLLLTLRTRGARVRHVGDVITTVGGHAEKFTIPDEQLMCTSISVEEVCIKAQTVFYN